MTTRIKRAAESVAFEVVSAKIGIFDTKLAEKAVKEITALIRRERAAVAEECAQMIDALKVQTTFDAALKRAAEQMRALYKD